MKSNDILNQGEGILRLTPTWVPRAAYVPGGRLKLDPRDLFALGLHRGGINTRWLSSTTKADNGPLTAEDEGLSDAVHVKRMNIPAHDPRTALGTDLQFGLQRSWCLPS